MLYKEKNYIFTVSQNKNYCDKLTKHVKVHVRGWHKPYFQTEIIFYKFIF
jgi:hypothetical protein